MEYRIEWSDGMGLVFKVFLFYLRVFNSFERV